MSLDVTKIRQLQNNRSPQIVTGNVVTAKSSIETFKRSYHDIYSNRVVLASAGLGDIQKDHMLDTTWLKGASETYNISDDINDYVIVPVPLITVDFPNRNLQGFPLEEMSFFDPLLGTYIYKSFIGKPTHMDHDNEDPLKAKGVNFDSMMIYVPKYKVWKVIVLSGFDRTKDPNLVNAILSGERDKYSMGCLVNYYVCSVCGAIDEGPTGYQCPHMRNGKGAIWKPSNRLAYQMCVGDNFIENSSVTEPADVTASSEDLFIM